MGGLSGLSGLGGLAGGFQQGVGFVQDLQDARQRHKMRKYALNQMGRDDLAAQTNSGDVTDEERAFYGDSLTGAFLPESGEDPFLFRMLDRASKRRANKRQKKQAMATSAAPREVSSEVPDMAAASEAAPAFMPGDDPDLYSNYADGGRVNPDDPEEIKKRAAKNRSQTSERGGSTTRPAQGADRTQKPSAMKTSRAAGGGGAAAAGGEAAKKGLLRRAVGSKLAGGAAAGAGIAGAIRAGGTDTEDYYTRFGMDPSGAGMSFWKDLGVRTLGTLTDVGDAAGSMFGMNAREDFADEIGKGGVELAPGMEERIASLGGIENVRRMIAEREGTPEQPMQLSTTEIAGRPTPRGRPAAPQQEKPYEAGDALDLADVDFDETEIPDLKVDDWKRYRAQALRTARLKGLPQAEALEQADRLVTTMQIRGFSNYASQAHALMSAGNLRGATRALRAAYQYFPDGNDVKFGVHNGKIVGVGVDEKTGEPFEGGTRVISPEFLAGAIQNFSNPQNFLAWTQDWRDDQFKRQKYEEVEKPLAEAQGQSLRTNADANVARAEAAALRAQMSGAGGGMKPGDLARSEAAYRQELEMLSYENPEQYRMLTSVMSQLKQRNPGVSDNQIMEFVMEAQKRPDGEAYLRRALGQ